MIELSSINFARGVLLGLRAADVTNIELLSDAGHYAAREALTYLQEHAPEQFDYRFLIIVGSYGVSDTWSDAVRTLYHYGVLRGWDGGEYEILVDSDDLDRWFRSQPGSPALWKDCAEHFLKEFGKDPSSR